MENQVVQESQPKTEHKFPSEIIELPSKGLVYPKENPLSSGKIEMKYMTAKEEDILTNQNYIRQGVVLDKLLNSLILSKVKYNDLIIGDKNAVLIAARVLGYGKDYKFTYLGEEKVIDLSKLENKKIDESLFVDGKNEFYLTLPHSGTDITFKILTHGDENKIEREITGLKKLNKTHSPDVTTRLKHIILSVNGDYEAKTVRDFVDNYLLAIDSKALRDKIREIQPDILSVFTYTDYNGDEKEVDLPIGPSFFFPDV